MLIDLSINQKDGLMDGFIKNENNNFSSD